MTIKLRPKLFPSNHWLLIPPSVLDECPPAEEGWGGGGQGASPYAKSIFGNPRVIALKSPQSEKVSLRRDLQT